MSVTLSTTIVDRDPKITTRHHPPDSWSKLGSMWVSDARPTHVVVSLKATENCVIGLWGMGCGAIEHEHLRAARRELLGNMHTFSPEAHFFSATGKGTISIRIHADRARSVREVQPVRIALKSCNRCGRFLPINLLDERQHLSFSNHCVAESRRPCKHGTFGRLRDQETGETIQLEYGFQLECRFCKKFEVNAAHNPQRTAAQMKEDAQRRRAFEALTMELYGESPQLRYRHLTGRELSDDVYMRFSGSCFKCGAKLPTVKDMHLDHTRPLALLWPLDSSATALCKSCNSEKRDRLPRDFYDDKELRRLATITGLSVDELRDPHPNTEAIDKLKLRLDWFFGDFLCRPELTKVRDGKTAAELLVKALYKVIEKCPEKHRFDFRAEFDRRRPN